MVSCLVSRDCEYARIFRQGKVWSWRSKGIKPDVVSSGTNALISLLKPNNRPGGSDQRQLSLSLPPAKRELQTLYKTTLSFISMAYGAWPQPKGKWSWTTNIAQRKHKVRRVPQGKQSNRREPGGNWGLDIKASPEPFRAVLLVGAHADWARGEEERRICRPAPRLSCKTRLGPTSLSSWIKMLQRAGTAPMEMVCAAHRSQSSVITSAGQRRHLTTGIRFKLGIGQTLRLQWSFDSA